MLQPKLPLEDYSLVIRTDFSDESAWQLVCGEIEATQTVPGVGTGFQASVEFISDRICADLAPEAVCALLPSSSEERVFVFVADSETILNTEHPVLVVDTEEPSRTFRVIPSAAWAVENNLRLANMGFDDFEVSLGSDGVFRGISR